MKNGPEITPSSKWVPARQITRQTSCGSSQAGNGNWPRRLNGENSITRRLTEWHNCAITLETHCLRPCQGILNKHQFKESAQVRFFEKALQFSVSPCVFWRKPTENDLARFKPKFAGMKQLNLYDMLAVVAPGAVLVIGLSHLFPALGVLLASKELSLGDFGLVLLSSYVAGNLLSPISHVVQAIWFKCRGGSYTSRIPKKDSGILHQTEIEALNRKARKYSMLKEDEDIRGISASHWEALTRQIRAFLANRGSVDRIEIFNAHYGLNRGLAAALLVIIIAVGLCRRVEGLPTIGGLLVGLFLAIYRMNDFGRYYATELMRHFINFTDGNQTETTEKTQGD